MNPPLRPLRIPGLFITGTDTDVGKTVVAGAIAAWFRKQGSRVAVLKPIATGCERRREGLVSTDAEFLAHCADSPHPLDVVCPQRFAEPLAPSVAAERARIETRVNDEADVRLPDGALAIRRVHALAIIGGSDDA